ncbi:MAG: DMT family transporter [Candidatus Thermoplasmatota archaeon]|nr:DMT family transporter [Candidatus Thermoplasmatota archaeon]
MKKGIIYITIASLFYAGVIVNTKAGLNTGLDSSSFTFLTMVFTLFVLLPYYFSTKKETITKNDYKNFFILGLFASGLAHFVLFLGQNYTSAVNAGFLVKITTLFTVVFAFFLISERLRRVDLIAIAVSFFGVFLLSSEGQLFFRPGDLLIVLSSFFLGFSNAFAKKLMSNHSSRTIVFWRTMFGIPVLFVFTLVLSNNPFSSFGSYVLLNGVFLGVTIMFLYKSIEVIGPSLSSTLFFISPLFSTFFAVILLKETISIVQLLGGAIILLGTYLIIRR